MELVSDPAVSVAIASFIYGEAECIDQARLDEWLGLFTENGTYWIPNRHGAADPRREVNIAYDDRRRLQDRVRRLTETEAHIQAPRRRSLHVIGNIVVTDASQSAEDSQWLVDQTQAGEYVCHANGVVTTYRRASQQILACRYTYRLAAAGDSFEICGKKVELLNCEGEVGVLPGLL